MEAQEYRRRAMALADGSFLPKPAGNLTWLTREPFGQGRVRWDVYACLYPSPPRFRLYTRQAMSGFGREALRSEVQTITLREGMKSLVNNSDAHDRLRTCSAFCEQHGLPLGMYLTGRFAPAKRDRGFAVGALWSFDLLGPVWTLNLLERATLEATR